MRLSKKLFLDKTNKDDEKSKEAILDTMISKKPNVKWSDVAGLVNAKKAL